MLYNTKPLFEFPQKNTEQFIITPFKGIQQTADLHGVTIDYNYEEHNR